MWKWAIVTLSRPDDPYGTYEYIDPISEETCIGLFTNLDKATGFYEVRDFECVVAPGDVPGAEDNAEFEPTRKYSFARRPFGQDVWGISYQADT